MKPKLKIIITKEDIGYSAICEHQQDFIATESENFEVLKKNIIEAIELNFEDQGYTFEFDELEIQYDLPSFFSFYNVINAKALAERIGMNQSLLAQYINGIKKPSSKQTKRILDGVHQIGRELSEIVIHV